MVDETARELHLGVCGNFSLRMAVSAEFDDQNENGTFHDVMVIKTMTAWTRRMRFGRNLNRENQKANARQLVDLGSANRDGPP